MQITILGVTAPIGAHACKLALDHGHLVIALVRGGPNALPDAIKAHPSAGSQLRVIKGDATNVEDLKQATAGSDAVLSCLGGRNNLKTTVAGDSTKVRHILCFFDVQLLISILPPTVKYVAVSNIGVGEESQKAQGFLVRRILVDWFMSGVLKDKLVAETALANSQINQWIALRGGWLSNRPENLDKVKFVELENAKVLSRVSRLDIAAVAIKLVEGGYGDQYWGKSVNLVSA
jgi:NAD(P)-dependent dehydrogenase (short-subunit alcohol dehydrogenase family)